MRAFIDLAGWTLVHFVWQGTAIALVTAAGLWLLRHARPQARYLLGCMALAAMTAAPIATAIMLAADAPIAVPAAAAAAAAALPSSSADAPGAAAAAALGARAVGPSATVLSWVVALWAAGATFLIVRLGLGWRRVGRLRRAAMSAPLSRWAPAAVTIADRLGLRRAVRIVDAVAVDTPVVIGWLQPVVLLPVAALANLTPAQVSAILAHELAHIRRHDFAINLLQALTETALFYHPAVWWLSNRIRAEREQCCDAIAVEIGGDPIGYVEALAEIESWRAGQTRLAVAATGGSLVDRVRRVLAADTQSPARGGAVLIASIVLLFVAAGSAALVTAIEPAPEPRPDAVAWRIVFDHPSGELTVKGFTGRDLVRFAYNVPAARVIGGPSWMDTESIDLSAHLAEDPGADGIQAVLREILESKLGLTMHVEARDFPAYALVSTTAAGPGLAPAAPCVDVQAWLNASPSRRPGDLSGQRRCGAWEEDRYRSLDGVGVTMADLASVLGTRFRRGLGGLDVIDRTGLHGAFDVRLTMSPLLATASRFHIPGVTLPGIGRLPGELADQLGVTIQRTTEPYDVIVVGNMSRPTE